MTEQLRWPFRAMLMAGVVLTAACSDDATVTDMGDPDPPPPMGMDKPVPDAGLPASSDAFTALMLMPDAMSSDAGMMDGDNTVYMFMGLGMGGDYSVKVTEYSDHTVKYEKKGGTDTEYSSLTVEANGATQVGYKHYVLAPPSEGGGDMWTATPYEEGTWTGNDYAAIDTAMGESAVMEKAMRGEITDMIMVDADMKLMLGDAMFGDADEGWSTAEMGTMRYHTNAMVTAMSGEGEHLGKDSPAERTLYSIRGLGDDGTGILKIYMKEGDTSTVCGMATWCYSVDNAATMPYEDTSMDIMVPVGDITYTVTPMKDDDGNIKGFSAMGMNMDGMYVPLMNYLAYGYWVDQVRHEGHDDFAVHAAAMGGVPFMVDGGPIDEDDATMRVNNLMMATGSAEFMGPADGLMSYDMDGSTMFGKFSGEATLMADFDTEKISGSVDIGGDHAMMLMLGEADIMTPMHEDEDMPMYLAGGWFDGMVSVDGDDDMAWSGTWGGMFFGAGKMPDGVAGTFGASTSDEMTSLVGGFGATTQ